MGGWGWRRRRRCLELLRGSGRSGERLGDPSRSPAGDEAVLGLGPGVGTPGVREGLGSAPPRSPLRPGLRPRARHACACADTSADSARCCRARGSAPRIYTCIQTSFANPVSQLRAYGR